MSGRSRDWNLTNELVAAAAAGDAIAIDRLIRWTIPAIRDLALVRLAARPGRFHTVEEIVQETAQAIANGVGRLSEPTVIRYKAYVRGIVDHKVADHLRRAAHALPFVDDLRAAGDTLSGLESRTGLLEMFGASTAGPGTKVARNEQVAAVVLAVARLAPDHNEAIELAFFCGLTTAEMGEQLGIGRNAAAMRLLRAIRALKREMGSELGGSDAGA